MFTKSILDKLDELNELTIRYAIFAGSEVALLTQNRTPTDVDIIVHNDDFDKLIDIFSDAKINRNGIWRITSSDKQQIICKAKNLEISIDNISIDIMSECNYEFYGKIISTHLTDLACNNRIKFYLGGQQIWLANPIDTIIIKSLMRRGSEQNKFDLIDCQELVKKCDINKDYLEKRLGEVNLDQQAIDFLKQVKLI